MWSWINFPHQPDGLITGNERAKKEESLYQIQRAIECSIPCLFLSETQSI